MDKNYEILGFDDFYLLLMAFYDQKLVDKLVFRGIYIKNITKFYSKKSLKHQF